MKKLITLLIAVSALCCTSLAQDCSNLNLRDINRSLTTGLACCEELSIAEGIIRNQYTLIEKQKQVISNDSLIAEAQQKSWELAHRNYLQAMENVNNCAYEVQRLKKGKRNWIIATLTTVIVSGAGCYYLSR